MAIYLVQHGVAVEKKVDPDRPLSGPGKNEVEKIARYLKQRGVTVSRVCHSGKLRAEQSAQVFANTIGNGEVEESSNMQPKDSAVKFADGLEDDDSLYVGHQPHIGKTAAVLLAGDEEADIINVTNAAVMCLELNEDVWQVVWYLTPDLCPS